MFRHEEEPLQWNRCSSPMQLDVPLSRPNSVGERPTAGAYHTGHSVIRRQQARNGDRTGDTYAKAVENGVKKNLITPIMRIQIELALAGARNDFDALRSLEIEAKHLTLSGAEIDAAKRGDSFDLLVDIAVKLALAVHIGDAGASAAATRQLAAFGVSEIAPELFALLRKPELPICK